MKSSPENIGGIKEDLEALLLAESQKSAENMDISLINAITDLLEKLDPKTMDKGHPASELSAFQDRRKASKQIKKYMMKRRGAVAAVIAIILLIGVNNRVEAEMKRSVFEVFLDASKKFLQIHAPDANAKKTEEYQSWNSLSHDLAYPIFIPNNTPSDYILSSLVNTTYESGSQLITGNYVMTGSEKYLRYTVRTYYTNDGIYVAPELLDWNFIGEERYNGILVEFYHHPDEQEPSENMYRCVFYYHNTMYDIEADMPWERMKDFVKSTINGG